MQTINLPVTVVALIFLTNKTVFMKFLKFLPIVPICMLFSQPIFSQTTLEKYEQESIYLTSGGFVKGGKKHSALFTYRGLKKAMKGSLPARAEYQRYSEKRGWAIGLSLAGLTSVIVAAGVNDLQVQRGMLLGGLGATIASIPLSVRSANHLQKSVWMYNRDLLLPEKKSK